MMCDSRVYCNFEDYQIYISGKTKRTKEHRTTEEEMEGPTSS